jgi:hypothetical protein
MSDSVCIAGYALSRIIHRIQYEIYFGNMYSSVHFVPRRIYAVFPLWGANIAKGMGKTCYRVGKRLPATQ